MNINSKMNNINFGRAFTTSERKAYASLLQDARKSLDLQDTSAIVFDFNVPSPPNCNTGIGTTFSESMKKFTSFLKDMTGITSIQLQPQGKIVHNNTSPYSGSNYAFGEHIIDLEKLTTPRYASLLSKTDVKSLDNAAGDNKIIREYRTDYASVLGNGTDIGNYEKALLKAHKNFISLVQNGDKTALKLNNEYQTFKQENKSWLEKNALFEALSKQYASSNINEWSNSDKNLFSSNTPESFRQERIKAIKQENSELIDFENFKQFIADKQQKESRTFLDSQNIKLYGDCLIGFSQSEMWSNINCFRENLYYGGPDPSCSETNGIQAWGLPALDYTKLGNCDESGDLSQLGDVGKLLYDKYTTFFKRYDGIRLDAAWQFITPFIYQTTNGYCETVNLPEINMTIFNILKTAAKDALGDKFNEQNPENIMLELVGMSADKSRELTRNSYPHLYTTAYAEYDETPKKFEEKGYKNGKFYVGIGCHDNDSLVNLSRDAYKRKMHQDGMKRDYNLDVSSITYDNQEYKSQTQEQKEQENYRIAKFAEIFTSAKHFFTLPDMFGMSERINISGKTSKDNWTVRIPSDYERFYFSQLSKGYGLNLPKALGTALKMKNSSQEKLIQKCDEAAEILRSTGPMTEEEANISDKKGEIKSKFEYVT